MKSIFLVILAIGAIGFGYITFVRDGDEPTVQQTVNEEELLPVAQDESEVPPVAESAQPVLEDKPLQERPEAIAEEVASEEAGVVATELESSSPQIDADEAQVEETVVEENPVLASKDTDAEVDISFMPEESVRLGEKDEEYVESTIHYDAPTMKKFSKMYWALGKFDINDDAFIDTFLFINECDIYKSYFNNEFEWSKIRNKAREVIIKERRDYPVRYEFLQPLRLANYNLDNKKFEIAPKYRILEAKNIEVMVKDQDSYICTHNSSKPLNHYQKGVVAELSRPFTLIELPISPELAKLYVETKNEEIKEKGIHVNNAQAVFDNRDAYLLMKVKFFSYKGIVSGQDFSLPKFLAVLEGYEVYADIEKTQLLYSENYLRKKKRSKMELELKRKYKERLKKQIEDKKKAQENNAK